MYTSGICQSKYDQLIAELREKLHTNCSFLFSAMVYGSYCRKETYSVYSDIDFLCIIEKEILNQEEVSILHNIVFKLHSKYKIKIHLRVRNVTDLYTKESVFFDCGFTSSINKLRDNVLIYGRSLDSEYLKYIENVDEEEYVLNLKLRYSNLKYLNRSLISLEEDLDNSSKYGDVVRYKCACILFQLAELICYTYGLHFVSSADALSKAYSKTNNCYFKMALNLKQGNEGIKLPHFIASIDDLIKKYAQKINPENIALLKRIVFQYSSISSIKDERIVESGIIIETCSVIYKRCFVATDGTLHIIINDEYEFNK